MTETLTFIGPDGASVVLSSAPYRWRRGIAGRGAPPVDVRETALLAGQGSLLDQIRDGARTVDVPVLVTGALRANLRTLARSTHGRSGEGRLVSTFGGVSRELPCRLVAGLEWVEQQPRLQEMMLSFRAFDPYWRDTTDIVVNFDAGISGTWLPWLPIRTVSDQVFSEADIDNAGDVEAWPVWTLNGPFNGVTLRRDDDVLRVDATFGDGDGLVIDTRPGFKTVTDFAGGSRFDALDLVDDVFWPLAAGVNDVAVSMESVGPSTSVSLAYRRRWLTA